MYSWGQNKYGQLGRVRVNKRPKSKFESVPDEFLRQDLVKGALHKVKVSNIACGWYHSLATTQNGLLFAWGFNFFGELGIGSSDD